MKLEGWIGDVAVFLVSSAMFATVIAFMSRANRTPTPGPGSLVICGGGYLPQAVRDEFDRLAGGPDARIVVIPTAKERADDPEFLEQIRKEWEGCTILHTRDRDLANSPSFVDPLRHATGVWITGGDQVYLTDAYLGTAVQAELIALYRRGGVIGGTSAGAAVMSDTMIRGGEQFAEVGPGFGLLTEAVVDQHFLQRRRMGRLAGVVTRHPGILGIGIDEETALVVHGDSLRVLGNSCVITCSTQGSGSIHPGDEASLAQLRGN